MSLIPSKFKNSLKAFILEANKLEQSDLDKAIDSYCAEQEKDVYEAIRSITILIPPGAIVVTGAQGPSTNLTPIILNNVVQ